MLHECGLTGTLFEAAIPLFPFCIAPILYEFLLQQIGPQVGAGIAALWAIVGIYLGRWFEREEEPPA